MTANAGRADYDSTIRAPMLRPGEPLWFVRAQDALAADNIRDWAARAFLAGVDIAVVEQALQRADAVEAWPDKKLPDADHLTEDQRKQLAYQFSRRAWRAAIPAVSVADILAAQREADARRAAARVVVPTADPATCKHAAWTFDAHGRLCPDCGTAMIAGGGEPCPSLNSAPSRSSGASWSDCA